MTASQTYPLPEAIQDAAKHGELVVFVGAGASMLCGSPDWRGFAGQVVEVLKKKGVLTFLDAEQLNALGDARRTLSIAMDIALEAGIPLDSDIDRILHPDVVRPQGLELYDLLAGLRPVFVTTNYDKWLDWDDSAAPEIGTVEQAENTDPRVVPRSKYYLREHLTSEKLSERGAVIHLHGSYSDLGSMVVSLRNYIEHYANERVQTFLKDMFRDYTVLFVGYGLAELEILEHIIRSNERLMTRTAAPRHFVLYAHRSSESAQTAFVERFFRDQCGVQIIPYCIDRQGFGELLDVFKAWKPQLDVRDPSLIDLQRHIDRCISDGALESKRSAAIRAVLRRPELTAYFLNSVKDPIWFEELDRAGFFLPIHNPMPKTVNLSTGTGIQAEWWPALRYLEHVAPLLMGHRAERLGEIVRQITADSNVRGVNNWRTLWSLAEIFSHLPLDVIQLEDIPLTKFWLEAGFEADMVANELGMRLLPRLLASKENIDLEKAVALVEALTMPREKGKLP